MTIPAKKETQPPPTTIEDVLIGGDLSKLTAQQRTEYYLRVCNSLGLNPMTRPFDYLVLNNKLQLYARRDAADQLRKLHGISIEIVSQDHQAEGLFSVHARAKDQTGRTDEDFGVVSMGSLRGDFAANMMLKCITKAKRRVTLSICGLGFLDETEVEDIPQAAKNPQPKEEKDEEETPHQIEIAQPHNWEQFGGRLLFRIQKSRSTQEANQWLSENAQALKDMAKEEESTFRRFNTKVQEIFRAGQIGTQPGAEMADEFNTQEGKP